MARTLTSAPRAFAPAAAPDALVGLDEATAQEVRAVLALLPPARLGALEQPSELLFEAGGDFTLVRFCAAGLAVVEIAADPTGTRAPSVSVQFTEWRAISGVGVTESGGAWAIDIPARPRPIKFSAETASPAAKSFLAGLVRSKGWAP